MTERGIAGLMTWVGVICIAAVELIAIWFTWGIHWALGSVVLCVVVFFDSLMIIQLLQEHWFCEFLKEYGILEEE